MTKTNRNQTNPMMSLPTGSVRRALALATATLALAAGCDGSATDSATDDVSPASETRTLSLAAPTDGDLRAPEVARDLTLRDAVNRERAPLAASWAVPATAEIARPKPFVGASRGFWTRVRGDELAGGVTLPVTTPNAVIKLSPAGAGIAPGLSIDAIDDIQIEAAGRVLRGADGVAALVTAEQLDRAGVRFAPGSVAFRLRPEIGAGAITLRANTAASAAPAVVVSVIEPDSDVALQVSTAADAYFAGDTLAIAASWAPRDGLAPRARQARAELIAPSGARTAIPVAIRADGAIAGSLPLALEPAAPGALWEVEVDVDAEVDGLSVRRTVKTAFAYARPGARLRGDAQVSASDDRLAVSLGLEVGSAGRYAVTGVLYGTRTDGSLRPAVAAQSAAVLEPGARSLELGFDRAALDESGLGAPYEVRDLRLVDQTRLALLHRQYRALALPTL